jgi:hypothetical protein
MYNKISSCNFFYDVEKFKGKKVHSKTKTAQGQGKLSRRGLNRRFERTDR